MSGSEGSEDDDYVPYVPVKIRKQQMVSYCAMSCLTLRKLVRKHQSNPPAHYQGQDLIKPISDVGQT